MRDLGVPPYEIDAITSYRKAEKVIEKRRQLPASLEQIAALEELGLALKSTLTRGDAATLLVENRGQVNLRSRKRKK